MSAAAPEPLSRRLATRFFGWVASVFQQIERQGEVIPPGPVLVVANHPNSLLDPLIVFRTAGRPTRPLAKAPLFQQAFVGSMLRLLGGLPVYRRQDDAAQMHRNDETFEAAIASLCSGEAVQIYPEGISHSEPALAPLRTGAARIALGAEQRSGWQLGLRVVPIGLSYRRKDLFRGVALARVGEPFAAADFAAQHMADPTAAVRALTETIERRLHELTLNLAQNEDRALIETADRLYSREKGMHGAREREALAQQLPRLQVFARGLGWLRANDPERHQRITRAVRRYQKLLDLFGASEGDVPPAYGAETVARYALREGAALLLPLPFALLGTLLWLPTFLAPRAVLPLVEPEHEAVSTYKVVSGFFAGIATGLLGALLAGLRWGGGAALLAPFVLIALGLVAIAWWERALRVREDVRIFLRVLFAGRRGLRIAAERARLVAEFDRILEEVPELRAGGAEAPAGV